MKKMFILLCCLPTALGAMDPSGKPPPPSYDAPGSPTLAKRVPQRKDSRSNVTSSIERRISLGHSTSAPAAGESPKKQVSFGHLGATNSNSEPTSPRNSMILPAPAAPAPAPNVLPVLIKAIESQTDILRQMAALQERQTHAIELLAQEIRHASVVNLRSATAQEDLVLCYAGLLDEENAETVGPAMRYLRRRWAQIVAQRNERNARTAESANNGSR